MTILPKTRVGDNIIGVGIDLIDIARIESALERQGSAFEKKVFTDEEIQYCQNHRTPAPHFAVRFAAKEAISKAFGTGIGSDFYWKTASIRLESTGAPKVILDKGGIQLLHKHLANNVLISLSHTRTQAIAIALLIHRNHED